MFEWELFQHLYAASEIPLVENVLIDILMGATYILNNHYPAFPQLIIFYIDEDIYFNELRTNII